MRAIYVRVRSTAVHLSRVLARQLPLPPPRSPGRLLAELSLREYSYRAPEIGEAGHGEGDGTRALKLLHLHRWTSSYELNPVKSKSNRMTQES